MSAKFGQIIKTDIKKVQLIRWDDIYNWLSNYIALRK